MEEKNLTLTVTQIDGDISGSLISAGFNLAEIVGHLEFYKQRAISDWKEKAKSGKKTKTKSSTKAK